MKFHSFDLAYGHSFLPNTSNNIMVFEPTSQSNQILMKNKVEFEHALSTIENAIKKLGFKVERNGATDGVRLTI